jgi:hypothetical protein
MVFLRKFGEEVSRFWSGRQICRINANYSTTQAKEKTQSLPEKISVSLLQIIAPAKLQPMIRPFQLRDLGLVRRLGERGVVFQTQDALTTIPHPLRDALANMLVGGGSTFVWKSKEPGAAAFIQLNMADGRANAHLASVGLEVQDSGSGVSEEDIWLPLLDQLVGLAGQKGVHNLIAEAAEDGPELPLLRRAGFVVYTRQDIWINDQGMLDEVGESLEERQPVDDWDISVLYSNIVPGMIQSVEPGPPLNTGRNWVLREEGELTAYVHVQPGSVADWMRLFIHPNARTKPRRIIAGAMRAQTPTTKHPMFCCVRRYQSWLLSALEKAGFRPWGSQAVMVKHIVQQVQSPARVVKNVMEPKPVPGSTTLIQGFSSGKSRNGQ